MLGGDVFILEPVGLFVGQVDDALDARGDEHLPGAAAINGGLGRGAQHIVQTLLNQLLVDADFFENLGDDAFRLLQQGQQDMLGVHLVVAVALEDFISARGGVLGALSKTIKSHHADESFLNGARVYCSKIRAGPQISIPDYPPNRRRETLTSTNWLYWPSDIMSQSYLALNFSATLAVFSIARAWPSTTKG